MRRLLPLILGLSSACAGSGADLPPVDEAFLSDDGKADGFGISEDSAEGVGILRLVNVASEYELDVSAGLNSIAAANIVEERTRDGIHTLGQLDDVHYVGIAAFRALYRYAEARGYFDTNVHGVQARSALAIAILDLVNSASEEVLDVDVGLDRRAAANIVEARQPTAIESLAQLDAIPYVGAGAFGALREYVAAPLDQRTIDTYLADMADDVGEYFFYEGTSYEPNVVPVRASSMTAEVDATVESYLDLLKDEWAHFNPDETFDAEVGEVYRVMLEGSEVGFVVQTNHIIDHPLFDGGGEHLYLNLEGRIVADIPWSG